jgi:transposase
MERTDITPTLYNFLLATALPLKSIETKFAIDSSGFSTKNFGEYCNIKHKMNKQHSWIKAHISVGVKTGIITSARITEENGADSPQFIPLLEETKNNGFSVLEATGDKAYSSRDNVGYVDSIGGIAYIPFRQGSSGKPRGKSWVWRKMFHYFMMNREEFMEHYHLRSNVESIFGAIKNKFGGSLKSRTVTAQTNELLLKLICYNITVLIQQMNELGINVSF